MANIINKDDAKDILIEVGKVLAYLAVIIGIGYIMSR